MSDIAIRVEGLGKKYRLGANAQPYKTLRESLADVAGMPLRAASRLTHRPTAHGARGHRQEFWALKDVSFEVKRGEVLGIIGRNGAGKSTLLKLLSQITEPTAGRIRINGRVASLLEVGTGFHPELTGRENVFLNGAILGMSRTDIMRKFDEIVAFAEVERFLDTPVKHYSSGMYLRLAFAVAAHLEPDILVLDEVLAVGDAQFQKKCLGTMEDIAGHGRTVLFVSHNMAAIESLCRRGIVLHQGQVRFAGSETEAIGHYLTSSSPTIGSLRDRADRDGSGEVQVVAIDVRDLEGRQLDVVRSGQDVDVYLYFRNFSGGKYQRLQASISVRSQMEAPVFLQHNRLTREVFGPLPSSGAFVCRIQHLPLPASVYRLGFSLLPGDGTNQYVDMIAHAADLTVVDGDFFNSGEIPPISHGVCLVAAQWRLDTTSEHSSGDPSLLTDESQANMTELTA